MCGNCDFVHLAAPGSDRTSRYRIFFIPGNPGLISYYTIFLSDLHTKLNAKGINTEVVGYSLGGFELNSRSPSTRRRRNPGPLDLQEQIEHVFQCLLDTDEQFDRSYLERNNPLRGQETKTILIGHSVGTFILLELLQGLKRDANPRYHDLNVVGAISLFPTILDLAKSPNGVKYSWLLRLSWFPIFVSLVVKIVVLFTPDQLLHSLVKIVTKFTDSGVNSTMLLLKSKTGVKQALYMAGDELNKITFDRWDEDVWGSAKQQTPKLFFYFGQSDHWVADHTRDDLISARAQSNSNDEKWKPVMEITSEDIPHAFCIRHNAVVADKCVEHVSQIEGLDQKTL